MGGAFLQWIVPFFFYLPIVAFLFYLPIVAKGEACFGEERECEDGQLGSGKEDVECSVVDPFDPCR